jgi:predicted nucleotidyltransferase
MITLAQELCTKIEEVIRPQGFHCALTGSTLYGLGKGGNDIDIMVYGHYHNGERKAPNIGDLETWLSPLFETLFFENSSDYNDRLRGKYKGVLVHIVPITNDLSK